MPVKYNLNLLFSVVGRFSRVALIALIWTLTFNFLFIYIDKWNFYAKIVYVDLCHVVDNLTFCSKPFIWTTSANGVTNVRVVGVWGTL